MMKLEAYDRITWDLTREQQATEYSWQQSRKVQTCLLQLC